MIRTMICNRNHYLVNDLPLDTAKTMLVDGDNIIWLDVEAPSAEEIQQLATTFKIHPLAVEDIAKAHQRPKIDIYDDFYFVVFYDIDYVEEGDLLDEHELAIVIGQDFLITIHHEPIEEIAEVATRFRRNVKEIERGIGVLLYSLLDTIVDHYFPVLDRIGERIEELESQVIEHSAVENTAGIRDIFSLKRELIHLRRQLAPQRDATAVLARRELPIISEATGVYFQDLYEHVLRVTDAIDVYRDLLSGVFDAYLSVNSNKLATASNNLNAVMKQLTSYSIILMSVTLVAGIYGMNFDTIPELHWRLGYPFALGLMIAIALGLTTYFKRKGWL
ncbi:MAG TPA: magnesium/cobalt transporter CorA [Thermomicrobiales bacterium]|jgi:magnesium transporter